MALAVAVLLGACSGGTATDPADRTATTAASTTIPTTTTIVETTTTTTGTTTTVQSEEAGPDRQVAAGPDVVAAMLATAAFQDVEMAEAAGYASTMDNLGCFENPELGGMGLHYLNESLMDDAVDLATPEALVYELGSDGSIAGLVAHEYIVPVEAWSDSAPPSLFGVDFHQHPVLPLWVLHAWLWKDNPAGMFEDWNPTVRLCPEGVTVFGS